MNSKGVMVNFTCQCTGPRAIWSNITLGISLRVFVFFMRSTFELVG